MKRNLLISQMDSLRSKMYDSDEVIKTLMDELEPEDAVFLFKPNHGTWGARNDFWESVRYIFGVEDLDIGYVKAKFHEFMVRNGGVMDPVADLKDAIANDEKVEKRISEFVYASRCVAVNTLNGCDMSRNIPDAWKLFIFAFAGNWFEISEKFVKVVEAHREHLGARTKSLAEVTASIRKTQSGGK